MKNDQADKNEPIPFGKAIGSLLLLYVLIAGPAIWQIRRNCLLQREDCNYYGLLEWVLSDRISLIVSVMFLGLLLFLTWNIIGRARDGTLGIEEDPPERKFNVNGLMVALIVFLVYLGGSLVMIMSATNDIGQLDADNADIFVWKIMGPQYGSPFVWMTVWHINDYFVKPVSNIVLFLLFSVTFGSIYLFSQLTISNW